jgi:enoyl-CoA hydratase/carnithine racemase
LKEATRRLAEKILLNGPTATVLQKKLVAQWMELNLSDAVEAGIRAFREGYKSGEPKEGMKAFLEKRKPNYQQ